MKERVTITLDGSVLAEVDRKVDGHRIKNRSHAIELLLMQALGSAEMPKVAVILAGGVGTRLQPITFEIPKPLVLVHDRTLLEHQFDLFKKFGIKVGRDVIGFKYRGLDYAVSHHCPADRGPHGSVRFFVVGMRAVHGYLAPVFSAVEIKKQFAAFDFRPH